MTESRNEAIEQRRFTRMPLPVPVIVIGPGNVQTLVARDVSEGGIYLHAEEAPPVGTPVRVEFAAGKTRRLSIRGVVHRREAGDPRSHDAGFAVRFDDRDRDRREIPRALASA